MSHQHPRPDVEKIYDAKISPLVKKVLDLCNSTNPKIPIATCSSFWSEEQGMEGSCSSFIAEKPSCSLRMEQIGACAINGGRPPMSINARLMIGGGKEYNAKKLDAKWYTPEPEHHEAMKKIGSILTQIKELVDETYCFPTAIVIQTPKKGLYAVIGKWGSSSYDAIQYMRVIAEYGYTPEATKLLLGAGLGNSETDLIFSDIMKMQELTEARKKGGIRGMLKAARDQKIRKNIQVSEEAFKRGKMIVPFLRVGEGEDEELDEALNEERAEKNKVKVKKEAFEKRKRDKSISSAKATSSASSGNGRPKKKKKVHSSSSSTNKKRRGVSLNWETPAQKKEKELARKDRQKLMASVRKDKMK